MDGRSDRPAVGQSSWGRAFALVGLVGLAITQPVLDLMGRNPEFFVAGRYGTSQIVQLGLVVVLVPALVAVALLGVATWLHHGLGTIVYQVLLALLGALFGNVLARGLGVDGSAAALVASVLGAAAALLLAGLRPGRLLLEYLAVANLFFLAGFLLISPTSHLLSSVGAIEAGRVTVPEPPGPVVVIIMDEFPVTTLLRDDGTINDERFPHFADLAARSTWFRNASSLGALTHHAVPTLLTGRLPDADLLPIYRDHPKNLLSLMGTTVPVDRYELVTDLCPPSACEPKPRQPLSQAIEDAGVVFAHRVLPKQLRDRLPEIDHSWGGFGDELGGETAAPASEIEEGVEPDDAFARWKALGVEERSSPRQAAILVERAAAIDASPSLHLFHVALPHYPWILSPWGTRLMEFPRRVEDPTDPAFAWSTREVFQLQSMQVGAADVALGQVIDHLDSAGLWEDTTLVVVSDHGTSTLPPDFGRQHTPNNTQELFRIPMFIKAPGQAAGAVRDEPALSVDLLPSLVDLLDIEVDWDFDGHSLFDGSPATVEPLVGNDLAPAFDIVRRHHADTPRGWDWAALAAVGDHGDLVGRPLADLTMGVDSDLSFTPDHEADFAALPTAAGRAPQLLTGVVGELVERPSEMVVAVNGTIAGALGGYTRQGSSWRFTSFLGPYLRDGANQIDAYEVEQRAGGPVLHRLR